MTMIMTRRARVRVLKCSTLAGLLALDDESRAAAGSLAEFEEVKKNASSVKVRLVDGQLVLCR